MGKKLKVGTTFSGIGAPEQSLKKLGVNVDLKWACDIDKHAKQAFLDNYEPSKFYDDIYKMDEKEIEDVDCYIFGFPCQAFSIAGARKGFEDTRGTLVYESMRILKEKKPKYFIAENVKGLTFHDKDKDQDKSDKLGNTFKTILQSFDQLDYDITWEVLNSNDYGMPQNRERVFIIGVRKDLKQSFEMPKKFKHDFQMKDFLEKHEDIPKELFLNPNEIEEKNITNVNRQSVLRQTHIWTKTTYEQSQRIYSVEHGCPCLTTSGTPKIHYKHKGKDYFRTLTAKEMLMLQGFPKNFKNTIGERQMQMRAGNSITVTVMEELFKNLLTEEYIK